jgi:broad-specificity NMP kinase
MAVRAISRQRVTDAEKLGKQQALLQVVYDRRRGGITEIDTREKSIAQVAAEIGRAIHISRYDEADMHKWLNEIEAGNIRMPDNLEV